MITEIKCHRLCRGPDRLPNYEPENVIIDKENAALMAKGYFNTVSHRQVRASGEVTVLGIDGGEKRQLWPGDSMYRDTINVSVLPPPDNRPNISGSVVTHFSKMSVNVIL